MSCTVWSGMHGSYSNKMRPVYSLVAFFLLVISAETEAQKYYGKRIGQLAQTQHAVKGEVYAVDSRTLHVKGFSYDGNAPDAFFYAGRSGTPSENGIIIPDENGRRDPLGAYNNKDVTITLPDGMTLKDVAWLSIWCREFAVNFGSVNIPRGLEYPRPQKIDGFPTFEHGVKSDKIVVVDAQTFLIPDFFYDGEAPDAFFWVGTGTKPASNGIAVPDENGGREPIKKYSGKTIVITLPDEMTVFDVDYLGVWCKSFGANFGHVTIPQNLNIPPSLKMLGVAPQKLSGHSNSIPSPSNSLLSTGFQGQPPTFQSTLPSAPSFSSNFFQNSIVQPQDNVFTSSPPQLLSNSNHRFSDLSAQPQLHNHFNINQPSLTHFNPQQSFGSNSQFDQQSQVPQQFSPNSINANTNIFGADSPQNQLSKPNIVIDNQRFSKPSSPNNQISTLGNNSPSSVSQFNQPSSFINNANFVSANQHQSFIGNAPSDAGHFSQFNELSQNSASNTPSADSNNHHSLFIDNTPSTQFNQFSSISVNDPSSKLNNPSSAGNVPSHFIQPSSSFGIAPSQFNQQSSTFDNAPSTQFNQHSSTFENAPSSQFSQPLSFGNISPSSQFNQFSSSGNVPSSQSNQPLSSLDNAPTQFIQSSSFGNAPSSQFNQHSSFGSSPSSQFIQHSSFNSAPPSQFNQHSSFGDVPSSHLNQHSSSSGNVPSSQFNQRLSNSGNAPSQHNPDSSFDKAHSSQFNQHSSSTVNDASSKFNEPSTSFGNNPQFNQPSPSFGIIPSPQFNQNSLNFLPQVESHQKSTTSPLNQIPLNSNLHDGKFLHSHQLSQQSTVSNAPIKSFNQPHQPASSSFNNHNTLHFQTSGHHTQLDRPRQAFSKTDSNHFKITDNRPFILRDNNNFNNFKTQNFDSNSNNNFGQQSSFVDSPSKNSLRTIRGDTTPRISDIRTGKQLIATVDGNHQIDHNKRLAQSTRQQNDLTVQRLEPQVLNRPQQRPIRRPLPIISFPPVKHSEPSFAPTLRTQSGGSSLRRSIEKDDARNLPSNSLANLIKDNGSFEPAPSSSSFALTSPEEDRKSSSSSDQLKSNKFESEAAVSPQRSVKTAKQLSRSSASSNVIKLAEASPDHVVYNQESSNQNSYSKVVINNGGQKTSYTIYA